MKIKRHIALLSCFIVLAGCKGSLTINDGSEDVNGTEHSDNYCSTLVSIAESGSRVSKSVTEEASADENYLKSVQFLLFDASDKLEAYQKVTDEVRTARLFSTKGSNKTIYAVANCDFPLEQVKTVGEMLDKAVGLADNNFKSFIMVGSKVVDLPVDTTVRIPIDRIVSKIRLNRVSLNLSAESLKKEPFYLKAVYVSNVVGTNSLGLKMSSFDTWYNKCGYYADKTQTLPSNVKTFTYYKLPVALDLIKGDFTTPVSFYVYPNPTMDDAYSQTFSPRKTRLVLETSYKDRTGYFPVTIDKVVNNMIYEFPSISITRTGSDDEETSVESFNADVKVVIKNWNTEWMGDNGNVDIK